MSFLSEFLRGLREGAEQGRCRRVEIMVTGDLSRVGVVRNAISDLQFQLFDQVGDTGSRLELRVTAFLDGCRHITPWSTSPINVGANTTRWHCVEGKTLYAEALAHSSRERPPIDAIVIYGERFDDDLRRTLRLADRLQKQGTRIFAFHVGDDSYSRNAYEQLAKRTGGVFVQLTEERAFIQIMPVIADYLFSPAVEVLPALPEPNDANVRALMNGLKFLPDANARRR